MNIFIPGTDITLVFDMVDNDTMDLIDPVSAVYDVFDDEGVQLVSNGAVTVAGGEDVLEVTVVAADNIISGSQGARTIVMTVTTATGAKRLHKSYMLEGVSFLAVPTESGMTLIQSDMLASNMAQSVLEVWEDTEMRRKTSGLREAWNRITRIPFLPWRDFEDVPDSTPVYIRKGDFSLRNLTPEEWQSLPENFRKAVKRAQLIEAAVILDGDPTWDRRQDGLISKTVGESSEMFAAKKSAFSTISPKAYREISMYIRRTVILGRA